MPLADFDVLVGKTEQPPVLVKIARGYCFLCWLLCLPCNVSVQGPAKHDPVHTVLFLWYACGGVGCALEGVPQVNSHLAHL